MRAAGLMREGDVDLVHAVLEALQVVAGHVLRIPGLDEARRVPVWEVRERRRVVVAEIGEDEIEIFARRIGLQRHLAGESRFLGRLLDALAATVKFPAVIDAADRLVIDPAEMQRGTAMRAAIGDDVWHACSCAVSREILAHNAQWLSAARRQVAAAADRMPELTHENAARRSRPRGRDIDVDARFAGALTRWCLLGHCHERAPLCAIIAFCRLGVACERRARPVTLRTSQPSECPSGEGVMTGIFASRWWIVFACACGLLVGAGAILIFTFGVFLKPITEDLGVSRGEMSGALGASTWFVAVSGPVIGWVIDRL